MDFSDFYFLRNGGKSGALSVTADNKSEQNHLSIFWGEKKIIEPMGFYRNTGSRPKDLILCCYPAVVYLITERFFELLEKEGFTGWGSYPVKISGKNDELVKGYRGLSIHGKCGVPDNSRRERIEKINPRGEIYYRWKGFYFDLSTWDGSDFFCPEGSTFKIVTKRVKDSIEKAKFTAIEFEQITEREST